MHQLIGSYAGSKQKGFKIENKNSKERLVYKLKKSLYGLKQSGRNWNNLLHTYLIKQGFSQSLPDICVYTKYKDIYTIIILWVDDIFISTKCNENLINAKNILKQKF